MKRTYRFVEPVGCVEHVLDCGRMVAQPVFPGILEHPTAEELSRLLERPAVARKYTILALRKAPWQVLRELPRAAITAHLDEVEGRPGRAEALRCLLS